MTIPKILLVGRIRAGKSEVAKYLHFTHGYEELAFGGMLKYFSGQIFAHSDVVKGGKPRALFQNFGQACREIDGNVWIQWADFSYRQAIDRQSTKGIVISDGRQPNEVAWARAQGFTVIRVTAPDELRMARALAAGDDFNEQDFVHDTELHVDTFEVDYEIVNDGTVEELYTKVDDLLTKIGAM